MDPIPRNAAHPTYDLQKHCILDSSVQTDQVSRVVHGPSEIAPINSQII